MASKRRDTGIDAARLAALRREATPTPEAVAPQKEQAAPVAEQVASEVEVTAPAHTPAYTPPELMTPAPREHMIRVQHYLRPDQIRRLDVLAKRTGRGVTRSDWLRYAADLLLLQDEVVRMLEDTGAK